MFYGGGVKRWVFLFFFSVLLFPFRRRRRLGRVAEAARHGHGGRVTNLFDLSLELSFENEERRRPPHDEVSTHERRRPPHCRDEVSERRSNVSAPSSRPWLERPRDLYGFFSSHLIL